MNTTTVLRALSGAVLVALAGTSFAAESIDARIDALLTQMTLDEKIGQLTQFAAEKAPATGPVTFKGDHEAAIRAGQIGSMLNVIGANATRQYQQVAMQSRLKIPLLFGHDVIHGYLTTFPIPLAEAASWDLAAIERSARIAATEAAAGGVHWTFAPMVDLARDPRWGRVMEGAGEDVYLGSLIAAARVKGFQGNGLGNTDAVMACAKHFAAYGAAEGGRDYNAVDMSERMLWEAYLPPFKAAVDAGVATVMNAFNDVNGVPATGNTYLQRDVLKGAWQFGGFVVSDWGSIGEMVNHGFVKDKHDAALAAIQAGNDMDMESAAYRDHLASLVKNGKVSVGTVDAAVRRILRKKFELGLFDDPYRFNDDARERAALNNPAHRQAARDMAAHSIVLLKNTGKLLPLPKRGKTIAFIGPMVKLHKENHGFWAVTLPGIDYNRFVVSQWDGVRGALADGNTLRYAAGCDVACETRDGFAEAVRVAQGADVVMVSVGERWDMSGEAKSRSHLRLPGLQEQLVQALRATGKPMVVLINAGRPLIFDAVADAADAVLYTWWLGSEAGNAIADVVFGDVNPSAKLPMTFPRGEGQIPIRYDHFNTGRPAADENAHHYVSAYIDSPNSPRYPFGYGLSYTDFAYSALRLSSHRLGRDGGLEIALDVSNTGTVAGDEIVQLYLRDKVASVVRPVKELKGFRKLRLAPGERQTVRFAIDRQALTFINAQLQRVAEPGEFDVMIGASSADIRLRDQFELTE